MPDVRGKKRVDGLEHISLGDWIARWVAEVSNLTIYIGFWIEKGVSQIKPSVGSEAIGPGNALGQIREL
ncbi:MAG TPA: hypothetical protein VNW28_10595, partial [Chthoniobacterales bacterium]|nr:hypothetical protein [Chthoniobacterales bacterium]